MRKMETESCQVYTRDTKNITRNHSINETLCNQNALQIQTHDKKGNLVHPFERHELKGTLKVENYSDNITTCQLIDEFRSNSINKNSSSSCNLLNDTKPVLLEKIPKCETEILGLGLGDEPFSSSDNNVDPYVNDEYSDCDLNSDPECDPFADVDCHPSFFQTPQSKPHDDSATDSIKHLLPRSHDSKRSRRQLNTESKLQCQLCLETQTCESKLKTHVEICSASSSHKNQSRRFCVPCNKIFCSPWSYRLHSQNSHGIEKTKVDRFPLRCPFCPRSFALQESLEAHHSVYHHESRRAIEDSSINPDPSRPFICQDCPSTFTKLIALTRHIKNLHKTERRFKCPEPNCESSFYNGSQLKDHVLGSHSNEKPFKCQHLDCNKTFKTRIQLRKHMAVHAVERPFKCPHGDCPKMFPSKEYLSSHCKLHRRALRYEDGTEGPFKCGQCELTFYINSQLTLHLKTHRKRGDNEFITCPELNCNSSFKYEHSLRLHRANIHTDQDALRIQCPEPDCDKIFKNKNSLRSHLFYIHPKKIASSVSFTCTQPNCEKTFKNKKGLADHLKYHTRPQKCGEPGCSARYATPMRLKWHMRSKHKLVQDNHSLV